MDFQYSLHIDGLTDIGNRRANNEDAWWAGQLGGEHRFMEAGAEPLHLGIQAGPILLLVSDGVGGANAGEVASQMAVNLISDGLSRQAATLAGAHSAKGAILAVLQNANAMIAAKAAEPEYEGMAATLSLLCFGGTPAAYWGQVGDSRIYVCRHRQLRQISRDHSPVGRMRQQGEITEAEARQHPLRNQIDQSLGDPNSSFQPDVGLEEMRPGDVYLLCSDGLSDGLWDHEIRQILETVQSPEAVRPAVRKLVTSAKQTSGRDNITAVVALVASAPPAAPGQVKPALWHRLVGR
jgi:serine/threonine protein phosphatase PrpC